jgi:hypothetical protein
MSQHEDPEVAALLNYNEKLVFVARISLWNYLRNFIYMGIWFVVFLFLIFFVNPGNMESWAGDGYSGILAAQRYNLFMMIAPYTSTWWSWLIRLIPIWFIWTSGSSLLYGYGAIKLILTDKRVIASSNFFNQEIIDYPLLNLESVRVYQDVNGRLFKYGNIILMGKGQSGVEMQGIKEPFAFKKMLDYYQSLEMNKNNKD